MVVICTIPDSELDVNIGRAYRDYLLAEKNKGYICLDTFIEWFRSTYKLKIVGVEDETGQRVYEWMIHFPSEADMVAFKLTHL